MTDQVTHSAPTLADIERQCKLHAERRTRLAEMVAALNDGIAALKKDHLPGIKRALARAAESQAELQALIESAPDLFVKPKTVIFHGIKVGYLKGKGTIEIADKARTVALIRRYLPEQADTLIRTVEEPHKPALALLSVADLRRVGCTVVETGEAVVIKAVDSEVDKMVDALLKDAVDAEGAAA
jgi:hypothetical protein